VLGLRDELQPIAFHDRADKGARLAESKPAPKRTKFILI
jgi:hypothetical protein